MKNFKITLFLATSIFLGNNLTAMNDLPEGVDEEITNFEDSTRANDMLSKAQRFKKQTDSIKRDMKKENAKILCTSCGAVASYCTCLGVVGALIYWLVN
ncbi:hypothetical protein KJ644_04115 [Candidatus Dependentiae bacterium]|nr:hypothetical protein [Candidatus Dependentiae bacterium]MBU4387631.1 hypothetical protein [Candidatus Dependentiae bacterium]MCG2756456.1 hypothetical protein [Candidatus Dependentiae bacterium]